MRTEYELILPTQVWVADTNTWEPLNLEVAGQQFFIEKPMPGEALSPVKETRGNEQAHTSYTVMKVRLGDTIENPEREWHTPVSLARSCLAWVRVLTRQYWLGVLAAGTEAIVRGWAFQVQEDGSYTYRNFGAYTTPIIPTPLSEHLWRLTEQLMSSGERPPVSHETVCDALLHMRLVSCPGNT
jgi:hypothetical protein